FSYACRRCHTGGNRDETTAVSTSASYTAGEADVGHTLRVAVVASNAAGSSAPATSPQTAVVTAALRAPSNLSLPAISGTAQEGRSEERRVGTGTGSRSARSYEWKRWD